jgi:4'-phosphopantetheinyl transferase
VQPHLDRILEASATWAHSWVLEVPATCDEETLLALLDANEERRAAAYRADHARHAFIVAHAFVRGVLSLYVGQRPGEIEIVQICSHCGGPHGKPRLRSDAASLDISLSHSRSAVLVGVGNTTIGVDVEDVRCELVTPALTRAAFPANEAAAILRAPPEDRPAMFFRRWVRREAFAKAAGAVRELSTIRLPQWPSQTTGCAIAEGWTLRDLPLRRGVAGAVVAANVSAIEVFGGAAIMTALGAWVRSPFEPESEPILECYASHSMSERNVLDS